MSQKPASPPSVASPTTDFSAFLPQVTRALDVVTTAAAKLPSKSDLAFHRTLDRKFAKEVDEASQRVLAMTEKLLALVEKDLAGQGKLGQGKGRRKLQDEDDVVDGYRRGVIEVVDGLLEDADSCLDELNGQKKPSAISVPPDMVSRSAKSFAATSSTTTAATLPKPQLLFPDPVDNSSSRPPFRPTVPVKHHAMVPLDHVSPLDYTINPDPALTARQLEREVRMRKHPYFHETRHLSYPMSMFTRNPPIEPPPLISPEWIDTPEALESMIQALQEAKEIAVDLEHHSMHSYHGFTCLMQISSREKDWVIDVIGLRKEIRERKLGGVFADPGVIKVFHGAESDITWLQKDFDLYVVNMFDTYHATVVLDMTSRSLAGLLRRYCDFNADKSYQLADWRLRPLSPEMMSYAQSDTHFLLYIYDNLRNELLEKSQPTPTEPTVESGDPTNPQRAMREVLDRSAETALRVFERETYDLEHGRGSMGWASTAKKFLPLGALDSQLGHVFKKLHAWRDKVAREEDEAPFLVMRNDMLRTLAIRAKIDVQAVRALAGTRSPMMSERASEVVEVIKKAQLEWRRLQLRKKSLSPAPAQPAEPSPATTSTSKLEAIFPTRTKGSLNGIWDGLGSSPLPRAVSSTSKLFGGSLSASKVSPSTTSPITAPKASSSLFGKTMPPSNPSRAVAGSPPVFADVKNAIHAGLAPRPVVVVEPAPNMPHLPEPETVPFVPSGSRSTNGVAPRRAKSPPRPAPGGVTPKMESDSTIVTVSRKKSKPAKATSSPTSSSSKPVPLTPTVTPPSASSGIIEPPSTKKRKKDKKKVKAEDIPVFDYATAPNLLDNPETGRREKKAKKNKEAKGPVVTDTKFGRVTRDMTQPKGGSRSGTFAS